MSIHVFDSLQRDLRDAIRSLRRTPAFTATAVVILGLGIGMASAMFTVFNQVLLKRLPVQDQDQLVEISGVAAGTARELSLNLDQYKRFSQENRTLQSVAGFAHWGAVASPVMDEDRLLSLRHAIVTGNFFQVLGAAPYLGRLLLPTDKTDYGPNSSNPDALVAVLSYDAWRREFGADPRIVGRRLRLPQMIWNPVIVGVAPPGLDYPRGVQFWTPNEYPGNNVLVARLARGVTAAAAGADYLAFVKADPGYLKDGIAGQVSARVESLTHMVVGDVTPALAALTIAVGMLLLLACINIGNLMLLRAAGRGREFAVRQAMGALRGDIARQLTTEGILLVTSGAALGLTLSELLLRTLIRLNPTGLPRVDMVRLEVAPFAVVTTVTLVGVLLFAFSPAIGTRTVDLSSRLRADGRTGMESRRLRNIRRMLVGSQLALAVILLAGAGLVSRTFGRLAGLDMGFPSAHVSFLAVAMPWLNWLATCGGMPAPGDSAANERVGACGDARVTDFHDHLTQALEALPGVQAASSVAGPPFVGPNVFKTKVAAGGQSDAEAAANPWIGYEAVGPEYFKVLGITMERGRPFSPEDREDAPAVAVVTAGVAKMLWPGADPIGKTIRMIGPDQPAHPLSTVVGVVHDIHFREHRASTPMIIRPYHQKGLAQGYMILRRGRTPPSLAQLRDAVHSADPDAVLVESSTMDELIAPQIAQPRLNAWLLTGFAIVALLLAAIGLFGIMASAVSQQTRELGVRMALGATPDRLRAMVLGQALYVAGAGTLIGLIGAVAGSRFLSSMLFEISPTDPVTLVGVSVLLLLVAALAAYLPARRATKIDPASALRAD